MLFDLAMVALMTASLLFFMGLIWLCSVSICSSRFFERRSSR
jgi:hypothetical protein